MKKIIIDCSGLKKKADLINSYRVNINSKINKLESIISSMPDKWKGTKANEFYNIMSEYIIELKKMPSMIDDYEKYLRCVALAYSELDKAFFYKKIDIR